MSATPSPQRPEGLAGRLKSFRTRAFTLSAPRPAPPSTTGPGGRSRSRTRDTRDTSTPPHTARTHSGLFQRRGSSAGPTLSKAGSSKAPSSEAVSLDAKASEPSTLSIPKSADPTDSPHDGASIASSRSPSRLRRRVSDLSLTGSIRRISLLGPSSPPQVESTTPESDLEVEAPKPEDLMSNDASTASSRSPSRLRRRVSNLSLTGSIRRISLLGPSSPPQDEAIGIHAPGEMQKPLSRSPSIASLRRGSHELVESTTTPESESEAEAPQSPPVVGATQPAPHSDTESVKERERKWGTDLLMLNPPVQGADIVKPSAMTQLEICEYLIRRGCSDLRSFVDPGRFSSCRAAEGAFGDVYKGQLTDGTNIAVKVLRYALASGDESKSFKRVMREIYNWSKLEHTNVHKLLGVTMFEGRLGMVSRWMENGTLQNYLNLPESKDINRYALCPQVAKGVAYLHGPDVNMIHGDLKACNILVSSDGILKLTDFDYSIVSGLSLGFSATTRMGGGTLRWMAPELVLADDDDPVERNKQTDVYALGMTFLASIMVMTILIQRT